ncbi:hypothetical protein J8I87_11695 [Paraburkholderia sp. LEh10]|uniref:HEPN/Toprim-associated domain-containing protein n=1 Tax=Paraburkholderia sp. LEh10 TaxID=2821353 RepID=UPI001AEB952F|nr:HEPN/Toprim-associated domain-containing protein [Paraburkholderia sp. LEh10]MBP0590363.1 hypothetical protein [Paraburkholderia sp. LEh10]
MTFRAYYMFDSYPVGWEQDNYDRWLFTRDDRIIRKRTKGQRNLTVHDLPENRLEWLEPETDYLYLTTADELGWRLKRKRGYDRPALEAEFERYKREMIRHNAPSFYVGDECVEVPQRTNALKATTLDDWLLALQEVIRSRVSRLKNGISPPMPTGPSFDTKALADIILTNQFPARDADLIPCHALWGFPCSAFDHLAVAMLEVIPEDAECALNITELVENDCVYCFEDLILAGEESTLA